MKETEYAAFGRALIEAGAEWADVTPDVFTRVGRHRARTALARQGVMFVLYVDHRWTLMEIADLLHRDHSTVSTGQKRFAAMLPADRDALDVARMLRLIRPDGRARTEVDAQREMAQAVIDMGRACRQAIEQMERTARATLLLTEGYE